MQHCELDGNRGRGQVIEPEPQQQREQGDLKGESDHTHAVESEEADHLMGKA